MKFLRLEVSFDYEGVFANLYDGDTKVASGYEYARSHDGWKGAETEAIAKAKARAEAYLTYGPHPADYEREVEVG